MAWACPRRGDPTVDDGEDRPRGLHRGIGGLIEDAPHLAIAFGTAVTAAAIFIAFRGPQAQVNQLRIPSQHPAYRLRTTAQT